MASPEKFSEFCILVSNNLNLVGEYRPRSTSYYANIKGSKLASASYASEGYVPLEDTHVDDVYVQLNSGMIISDKSFTIGKDLCRTYLETYLRQNAGDPVLDYLKGLENYGSTEGNKLETWIEDLMEVKEDDIWLSRWISQALVCAMVQVGYRPGSRIDLCPVITSEDGGVGKSTAIEKLVDIGEGLHNSIDDFESAKVLNEQAGSAWLCEIEEGSSLVGVSRRKVKRLVSQPNPSYRDSYDRRSRPHPRGFMMVGSTNQPQNTLRQDDSGYRRFPLLEVSHKLEDPYDAIVDYMETNRNNIFAEAVRLYREEGSAFTKRFHLVGEMLKQVNTHVNTYVARDAEVERAPYFSESKYPQQLQIWYQKLRESKSIHNPNFHAIKSELKEAYEKAGFIRKQTTEIIEKFDRDKFDHTDNSSPARGREGVEMWGNATQWSNHAEALTATKRGRM